MEKKESWLDTISGEDLKIFLEVQFGEGSVRRIVKSQNDEVGGYIYFAAREDGHWHVGAYSQYGAPIVYGDKGKGMKEDFGRLVVNGKMDEFSSELIKMIAGKNEGREIDVPVGDKVERLSYWDALERVSGNVMVQDELMILSKISNNGETDAKKVAAARFVVDDFASKSDIIGEFIVDHASGPDMTMEEE